MKKVKSKWKIVPDDCVRHTWWCTDNKCHDAFKRITVTTAFYADAGTPICSECGADTNYIMTEVKHVGKRT